MRPEMWLREARIQKARKRLKFWTKEDLVNTAKYLYGTDDLTIDEVLLFAIELKKPDITPPGGFVARDPIVLIQDNKSNYTNTGKSRIYLSKNRVKIQFKDMKTAFDWGYRLMIKTGLPWEKALARWSEGTRFNYFHEIWVQKLNIAGLLGLKLGEFELDKQLLVTLNKTTITSKRETTAYPDNTPLIRKYNSLGVDDKLVDAMGNIWRITSTKPKLSGPPEIFIELEK